jgi:hypothetical protein
VSGLPAAIKLRNEALGALRQAAGRRELAIGAVLADEAAADLADYRRAIEAHLKIEARFRGRCAVLREHPPVAGLAGAIEAGIRQVEAEAGVPRQSDWARRYWEGLAADPAHPSAFCPGNLRRAAARTGARRGCGSRLPAPDWTSRTCGYCETEFPPCGILRFGLPPASGFAGRGGSARVVPCGDGPESALAGIVLSGGAGVVFAGACAWTGVAIASAAAAATTHDNCFIP